MATTGGALAAQAALELQRDLSYLLYLALRVAACNALQACAALLVHAIGTLLPSPHHRGARLALGAPLVAATAAAALSLFNPRRCALGAAAAGTLSAFNMPLRAAQLLATPLRPPSLKPGAKVDDAQTPPLSNVALAVLLAVIPACPLLPALDAARRRPAKPVAAALPGVVRASAQFAAGSVVASALPLETISSTPVLLALMTLLTSAFATWSTSVFALASGVAVSSPFSWPWFSPSLASFWAWRWNAPIADALRGGVYEPLVVYGGAPPAAGVLAAFFVSGAAHALILRAAGVGEFTACLRWFAFFVVQGAAVLAERAAGMAPGRRRAMALGFTLVSAHYLFVLPVVESDAFAQVVWELGTGVRVVRNCAILVGFQHAA